MRLARTFLVFALSVIALPLRSEALEYAAGYVGIYADSAGTETTVTAPYGVPVWAHVIATATLPIVAASFRVVVSTSESGWILSYEKPANSAVQGSMFDYYPHTLPTVGTTIRFDSCQPAGIVDLGRILFLNFGGQPLQLTVAPRRPYQDAAVPSGTFTNCDEQLVSMTGPIVSEQIINCAGINTAATGRVPAGRGVVAGVVQDPDGDPHNAWFDNESGYPFQYLDVDTHGRFGFAYSPGQHSLIARGGNGLTYYHSPPQNVVVQPYAVQELTFTLYPPVRVRVRAWVRYPHDDDAPYLVPIPDATVRLRGTEHVARTDQSGFAQFLVGRNVGGIFDVLLSGDSYHVKLDYRTGVDVDPVQESIPMSTTSDQTEFVWSYDPDPENRSIANGPPVQAAWYIYNVRQRFRQSHFGYYGWELPRFLNPQDANAVKINIYDENPSLEGDHGGAGSNNTIIDLLRHRGDEADVVYHEFIHCVIADRLVHLVHAPWPRLWQYDGGHHDEGRGDEGAAMDEGLADYFAATFTNDPEVARCHRAIWPYDPSRCTPMRRVDNDRLYPYPGEYRFKLYPGSEIFSGALWDLRNLIGGSQAAHDEADGLIFKALDKMIEAKNDATGRYRFFDFYSALLAVDASDGGNVNDWKITQAFEGRNIVNSRPRTPLEWLQDQAIRHVEREVTRVRFVWEPLVGAQSYQVLVKPVDYNGVSNLGSYFILAQDVTDTTFVYEGRDPRTEYLFAVVPVDSAGQAGYESEPIYVAALDTTVVDASPTPTTQIPRGRWLFNSPNPSNPNTRIIFETSDGDNVAIGIYNVGGQVVRRISSRHFPAGRHSVLWDGFGDDGRRVASGQYLVVLQGSTWRDQGKVVLLQ